jgi:hypothetical protein
MERTTAFFLVLFLLGCGCPSGPKPKSGSGKDSTGKKGDAPAAKTPQDGQSPEVRTTQQIGQWAVEFDSQREIYRLKSEYWADPVIVRRESTRILDADDLVAQAPKIDSFREAVKNVVEKGGANGRFYAVIQGAKMGTRGETPREWGPEVILVSLVIKGEQWVASHRASSRGGLPFGRQEMLDLLAKVEFE